MLGIKMIVIEVGYIKQRFSIIIVLAALVKFDFHSHKQFSGAVKDWIGFKIIIVNRFIKTFITTSTIWIIVILLVTLEIVCVLSAYNSPTACAVSVVFVKAVGTKASMYRIIIPYSAAAVFANGGFAVKTPHT